MVSVIDYTGRLTPPEAERVRRVGTQKVYYLSKRAHNGPERSGEEQKEKQN